MRATDIKIGREYAFRQSPRSPVLRVKIIIPLSHAPGWLVEFLDEAPGHWPTRPHQKGTTTKASGRQIVGPWNEGIR